MDERICCSVDGCPRKRTGHRSYCKIHYNRITRYGRTERVRNWDPGAACSVEGCDKPRHANGYCATHYARVARRGEPGGVDLVPQSQRRSKYSGVTCAIEDCDRPARCRGWCNMHYQRWRYAGDAEGRWGAEPRRSEGFITTDGYRKLPAGRLEHRVVMEQMIGRPLDACENVHHKNGQRADNRPENLELWVTRQPQGQRVEDLVAFVVDHYPDLVSQLLAARDG